MSNGEVRVGDGAQDTPHVGLLVDTSASFDRTILQGVVRYARLHGPWRFSIEDHQTEGAIQRLCDAGVACVVARMNHPEVANRLRAAGRPIIGLDVTQTCPHAKDSLGTIDEVVTDSPTAATMAADHLLERGYRHIAFVGVPGRLGSQRRAQAVRERVERSQREVHEYPLPTDTVDPWQREAPRLAAWLSSVPRPFGVVACHDARGRQVLEAARRAGIRIPDEVAAVGIGDDGFFCELESPPLSSVAFNVDTAGFRLAERLDQILQGGSDQPRQIVVEPTHVVARRSTDVTAVDDPDVAAAMHFIHEHATEKIGVEDIVEPLCVSRRALELRFRHAIGRTVYGELQRVRVERAKRLLIESELPIPRVAEGAGFSSGAYLAQVFRKAVGMTPAEFRRQKRS